MTKKDKILYWCRYLNKIDKRLGILYARLLDRDKKEIKELEQERQMVKNKLQKLHPTIKGAKQ